VVTRALPVAPQARRSGSKARSIRRPYIDAHVLLVEFKTGLPRGSPWSVSRNLVGWRSRGACSLASAKQREDHLKLGFWA
jgi:hypothetical protein